MKEPGSFSFGTGPEPVPSYDEEGEYRRAYLPDDAQLALKVLCVWALVISAWSIKDIILLHRPVPFYPVFLSRVVFVAVAAVSAVIVKRTGLPSTFDRSCAVAIGTACISQWLVFLSRPPDYPFTSFTSLITIMVICFLFPLATRAKIIFSSFIAVTEIYSVFFHKTYPAAGKMTVIFSYVLVFYASIEGSAKIYGMRRRGFLDTLALKEQKRALERARAEIKVLSGFLPICASCKRICDEKGVWHQMETYISEHSEAEFSHGICPECRTKLYPQFPKNK